MKFTEISNINFETAADFSFYCSKCEIEWEGDQSDNYCPDCGQFCVSSRKDMGD